MKTYTIEIVINEGNDEFWEELNDADKSGCDDVKCMISDVLGNAGFDESNCSIKLKKFTDKELI